MRIEVRDFAEAMEARLLTKDAEHAGNSWKRASASYLWGLLHNAQADLATAIDEADTAGLASVELRLRVAQAAVDVGNYAMMIADVA